MSFLSIPTLLLAESLMLLQLAALVYVSGIRVRSIMSGPRIWAFGLLAYAASLFTFSLVLTSLPRWGALPDFLASLGCAGILLGIDDFFERPRRWRFVLAMLVCNTLALLLVGVVWPDYHARLTLFSITQVVFGIAGVRALRQPVQPQRRLGHTLFRGIIYCWCLVNLLRLVLGVIYPTETGDLHALRELVFYVLVLFFGIWLALGCMLLIHERIAAELMYATKQDPLTNCFNRRGFGEIVQAEARRIERAWSPTSMLRVDIDNFKHLIQRYGMNAGDEALLQFVRVVREELRDVDSFARLGSDAFAILLLNAPGDGAQKVAERLRRRVEDLVIYTPNGPLWFTVSIGVTSLAEGQNDVDLLLVTAEKALEAAQSTGQNRVQILPMPV